MKYYLGMASMLATTSVSVQVIEAVNSIDVDTSVVYYADSIQVSDIICCDILEMSAPSLFCQLMS